MKKIITFSTVCLLLLLSCSKNKSDFSEEEQQYCDVSFKVSAYKTNVRPMGGVGEDAEVFSFEDAGITSIEYVVFNTVTNKEVIRKNYPTIGHEEIPNTITFKLLKGSYRIVAVAQGKPILSNTGYGFMVLLNSITVNGVNQDTFMGHQNFVVENTTVEASLNLSRITGKLDFIAQGAIPEDVWTLTFKFTGLTNNINLLNNQTSGQYEIEFKLWITNLESYSDEFNIFSFYIVGMPEDSFFTLTVIGKNIENEFLFEEKIDVPIQVFTNKITELIGPLFSDQSTDAGANITISDPSWDDDKIIINL